MARTYITTATTTQCAPAAVSKVIVQVNATMTGTIAVIDGITGSTPNIALITNPIVGSQYEYWDFQNGVRIITSVACDVSVNTFSGHGAK